MHAWNYGVRIAEGGQPPPSPDVFLEATGRFEVSAAEVGSSIHLGPDTFFAWATRGWWSAHASKESA